METKGKSGTDGDGTISRGSRDKSPVVVGRAGSAGLEAVAEDGDERAADGNGTDNPEEKDGAGDGGRRGSVGLGISGMKSITSSIKRAVRNSFAPRMSFSANTQRLSVSTSTNASIQRSSNPSLTQPPSGGGIVLSPLPGSINHAKIFIAEEGSEPGSEPGQGPVQKSGSGSGQGPIQELSHLEQVLAASREALEAATATTALLEGHGLGQGLGQGLSQGLEKGHFSSSKSSLLLLSTGEEGGSTDGHIVDLPAPMVGGGSGGRSGRSSFNTDFGKDKDKDKDKEKDRRSRPPSAAGNNTSRTSLLKRGERRSFTGK